MRCRVHAFLATLLVAIAPLAQAAARIELLTPSSISVAGGESQLVSVRLLDAAGQPAAGGTVQFMNDACGLFHNNQFSATLVATSAGLATVRFTASNPPGITCWITIASGTAQVVVDVLTYSVSGVRLETTLRPSRPPAGASYVLSVKPAYGLYGLDEVEVSATVINGSGSATLSRASGNTGSDGYVDFDVFPSASGDYAIEVAFRTQRAKVAMGGPERTWQDMWWVGSAENGWGMSIVQHRDVLFAVIYAYDDAGKPTWFVIPGGSWNATRTEFTGLAYVPTGSPFYAYDPSRFLVGPSVGTVRLAFSGPDNATLDYTLNGKSGHKSLERNLFGPPDITSPSGVGDMWWGGPAQDGWGIAVLQQYRTLFTVWFTYDGTGAPTWYVMPAGVWTDAQTYEGRVFRANSSSWLGAPYDATRFKTTDVGSFRVRFAGDSATFDYTVEGRSGSIPLMRYSF